MKSIKHYILLAVSCTSLTFAAPVNVAAGKAVTTSQSLTSFAYVCGTGAQPSLSSVTDGAFLASGSCYQQGVFWADTFTPGLTVDIDLGGTFLINSAIVQVDNNDVYRLEYRDTGGVWHDWWTGISGPITFGMETRPNPADNTQVQALAAVQATAVRVSGSGGDNVYAVSEVQVFSDSAVPEPSTILLTAGAGLLLLARRRFQAAK